MNTRKGMIQIEQKQMLITREKRWGLLQATHEQLLKTTATGRAEMAERRPRSHHRRHEISHCSSSHCCPSLGHCSVAHFPPRGRKIRSLRRYRWKPGCARTRTGCWIAGWRTEVGQWGCVQSVGPSGQHRYRRNLPELTEEREHSPSRAPESAHQRTSCCCCCCSREELPSWGVVGTLKAQVPHQWQSLFRLPAGKEIAVLLWRKSTQSHQNAACYWCLEGVDVRNRSSPQF